METTFITIHNLLPDANILFASESIYEILGYNPEDVIGRSCFDYFHPDEIPFARNIHSRGVQLDKAAVLHYTRIRSRNGEWVGCECVFTVVYEVLVASTSIYKGDEKNERRAIDAPAIRRLFASSPRDPRYHMLQHLSPKFRTPPRVALFEPRAALILNRFTRNLTVMYATNAVSSILGIEVDQVIGKSFYECISENCLPDAVNCLESAKANDSIAYLRFWYRDPRHDNDLEDRDRSQSTSSDSDEDGGVQLNNDEMDIDEQPMVDGNIADIQIKIEDSSSGQNSRAFSEDGPSQPTSRTSSGQASDLEQDVSRAVFDGPDPARSSTSSLAQAPEHHDEASYEIEAVVSCTSDGLVVVLRRARPRIPGPAIPRPAGLGDGLFAAPWGANPIRPHLPRPNQHGNAVPVVSPVGGPSQEELLNSIQEVAVFAWSLIGINGSLAEYGHGVPRGEAQPPGGIPIWDPYALPAPSYLGPENQAARKWADRGQQNDQDIFQPSRQHDGYDRNHDFGNRPQHGHLHPQNSNIHRTHDYRHPASHGQHRLDRERSGVNSQSRNDQINGYDQHSSGEGSNSNHHLWY